MQKSTQWAGPRVKAAEFIIVLKLIENLTVFTAQLVLMYESDPDLYVQLFVLPFHVHLFLPFTMFHSNHSFLMPIFLASVIYLQIMSVHPVLSNYPYSLLWIKYNKPTIKT